MQINFPEDQTQVIESKPSYTLPQIYNILDFRILSQEEIVIALLHFHWEFYDNFTNEAPKLVCMIAVRESDDYWLLPS